jgi:hypothetical protein
MVMANNLLSNSPAILEVSKLNDNRLAEYFLDLSSLVMIIDLNFILILQLLSLSFIINLSIVIEFIKII